MKVSNGTTKYLLKHAARGLVPDHVIDKPKVGFFNAAVDAWFSTAAGRTASDFLLDPAARYVGIIDPSVVAQLLGRQQSERPSAGAGHALLSVLMLELWLSTFLPRATSLSSAEARGDGRRQRTRGHSRT
jgi:asparagine synthase (glutamine-hydrolysing)